MLGASERCASADVPARGRGPRTLVTAFILAGCPALSNAGPWDALLRVLIGWEGQDSGEAPDGSKRPATSLFA